VSKRDRFEFRLGQSDRDRELSRQLKHYAKKRRASDLVKELLRAYFSGELDTFQEPGGQSATQVIDERTAAIAAKLRAVQFKDLE